MVELEYGLVEREVDSVTYHGLFMVEHGMVTVCSPMLGEQTTQVGNNFAHLIAGHMLRELIDQAKARGDDMPGQP